MVGNKNIAMARVKALILTVMTLMVSVGYAQKYNYVIPNSFQPLSYDELLLSARAEAYRQQKAGKLFEEYQDKAYQCYNKGDYSGFIFYSEYALNTGWYSSKLYYDRGVVFEKYHEYRKAKKEYKKAIKSGYYPAQNALEQCKAHQKNWKKSH